MRWGRLPKSDCYQRESFLTIVCSKNRDSTLEIHMHIEHNRTSREKRLEESLFKRLTRLALQLDERPPL